jgi:glycosyltransferase involved in cell wall biosynthesis
MKVICWYPALTDHQSFTIKELKIKLHGELDIYVFSHIHKARVKQHWVGSDAEKSEKKVISGFFGFKTILKAFNNDRNAIHVFGSPFENIKIIATLFLAICLKKEIYLISEPYSPIEPGYLDDRFGFLNKVKQRIRPFIYKFYGVFLCKNLAGVFAISKSAMLQYRKLGFANEKIYPFGYFVSEFHSEEKAIESPKNKSEYKVHAVFVGNLISIKGLDLLIEAVNRINISEKRLALSVYGSGDASKFKFDGDSVVYRGIIPFGKAQSVINKYDFLVLPSRYDGWGVVVNESVMAAVPVLVSHMVGAGTMLTKWNCGLVFDLNKAGDLDQKLLNFMDLDLRKQLKDNTKKLKKYLTPKFAANYMYQIFLNRRHSNKVQPEFPCYDID